MAKAQTKPTPVTWTFLENIYPRILENFGSPQICGPWLVEQISSSRVRWRAKATRPPDEPFDDFWQGSPSSIEINFAESMATKLVIAPAGVMGFVDVVLLGLEVAREDIDGLIEPSAE